MTVVFVSLNFVACAEKKDNKTRLTKGAGRSGTMTTQESNGWSTLNAYSELTQLSPMNGSTPDTAARAFIGNDDAFYRQSDVNGIQLRLVFSGNQINSAQSKVGFKFYDDYYEPLSYYVGSDMGATFSGSRNGNSVNVTITEIHGGTIEIRGSINGSSFHGSVTYDGGKPLGTFQATTNRSIFNY